MEPTHPLVCAPEDWSPCEAALDMNSDILFEDLTLPEGFNLWPMGNDGSLGLFDSTSTVIQDVYGNVVETVKHPDATGTFGATQVRGVRTSEHFVGFYAEDFANFKGMYGYRWVDGVFEKFDIFTALGINGTESWGYIDQGIADENADGDLVGYFWDDTENSYFPFKYSDGEYSILEVPGSTRQRFAWALADNGVYAGRATFGDAGSKAYWVETDGTIKTLAPEDSTRTTIFAIASDPEDGSPLAFAGYYRLDLSDEETTNKGFLADPSGAIRTVEVDGASETRIFGMSDRCAMIGYYTSDDETRPFLARPRNPLEVAESPSSAPTDSPTPEPTTWLENIPLVGPIFQLLIDVLSFLFCLIPFLCGED